MGKINNLYNRNNLFLTLLGCILFSFTSCTKLIEVNPPVNSINSENIYGTNATAASVLTGIYSTIMSDEATDFKGISSLSMMASLSADELSLFDVSNLGYLGYYQNKLTSSSASLAVDYWSGIYPLIFKANAAIEGIESSTALTPELKQQLLGEAKFFRAFSYFYLTNLFGDIPLALSSDWKLNSALKRSPQEQVYQQIRLDLNDASALLSEQYLQADALTPYPPGSEERVRPTKWAAIALLSRVCLYTKDWQNAEKYASTVIDNSLLFETVSLEAVFVKNSREAIWQLQPVGTGPNANTGAGRIFVLPPGGPGIVNPVYLSNNLLGTFENSDLRKTKWVGNLSAANINYAFPFKYKAGSENNSTVEYSMVLRLAEQYLIRSEARAKQNKISEAKNDLDIIRARAGLPPSSAANEQTLLNEIFHERQVELFTEWGDRWLELKRRGVVTDVMQTVTQEKGGQWSQTDQLYPIPQVELDRGRNLRQNPGY